jgi:hypothetical protein
MRNILFVLLLVATSFAGSNDIMGLFFSNTTLFAGYSFTDGTSDLFGKEKSYSNDFLFGAGVLSFNKLVEVSVSCGLPFGTNDNRTLGYAWSSTRDTRNTADPVLVDTVRYDSAFGRTERRRVCSIDEGVSLLLGGFLVRCSYYTYLMNVTEYQSDSVTTYYRDNGDLVYLGNGGWHSVKSSGIRWSHNLCVSAGYKYEGFEILVDAYYGDFTGFGLRVNYHLW